MKLKDKSVGEEYTDMELKEKGVNTEYTGDDFSLYTERIVVNPRVKYKKVFAFFKLVMGAVLFGAVACGVIVVLYPFLDSRINSGTQPQSSLTMKKDQYFIDYDSSEEVLERPSQTDEASSEVKSVSEIVENAKKCMVELEGTDISEEAELSGGSTQETTAGLIVGELDDYYVILTDERLMRNTDGTCSVKYSNSSAGQAYLIGSDSYSGMALLRAEKSSISEGDSLEASENLSVSEAVENSDNSGISDVSDISDIYGVTDSSGISDISDNSGVSSISGASAASEIAVAFLDNSYIVDEQDDIIAVGKISGSMEEIRSGKVNEITTESSVDNSFEYFHTDIEASFGDYCYFFNMSGNVIGIGRPSKDLDKMEAIGISDLKPMIEVLASSPDIIYFGIKSTNVTTQTAERYKLPMGIYITDVIMDSPAFYAGLQAGDVITALNGNTVLTIQEFSEKLYRYGNGENITVTVKRAGREEYRELTFSVILSVRQRTATGER